MRVLVFSEMFPRPADPVSGSFVLTECEALSRHGVQFRAVSPVPYSPPLLRCKARWRCYGEVPPRATWQVIETRYPRYLRVPGRFFRKFEPFAMLPSVYLSLRKWCREKPFDLIHAHGLLPCGMAAILLSKIVRIPCVCQARGSDVNVYPRESKANFLLTRYVIENCDAPAAVSRALARRMASISRLRRAIRVLYTTIDTERFAPVRHRAGLRERLGIPRESFVALYVGFLSRDKGIADLAEAWKDIAAKLPASLLVVVGDGPLSQKLAELGRSVLLCGRRPHAEIASWMQASDVLVLSSYREGFPTVVVEGMACGLPVVATSVGGIPEAVVHGETGLLSPTGDCRELASSILRLAGNEERRRSMGKAGRGRVQTHFGSDRYVSNVLELYNSLLKRKRNSYGCPAVHE